MECFKYLCDKYCHYYFGKVLAFHSFVFCLFDTIWIVQFSTCSCVCCCSLLFHYNIYYKMSYRQNCDCVHCDCDCQLIFKFTCKNCFSFNQSIRRSNRLVCFVKIGVLDYFGCNFADVVVAVCSRSVDLDRLAPELGNLRTNECLD